MQPIPFLVQESSRPWVPVQQGGFEKKVRGRTFRSGPKCSAGRRFTTRAHRAWGCQSSPACCGPCRWYLPIPERQCIGWSELYRFLLHLGFDPGRPLRITGRAELHTGLLIQKEFGAALLAGRCQRHHFPHPLPPPRESPGSCRPPTLCAETMGAPLGEGGCEIPPSFRPQRMQTKGKAPTLLISNIRRGGSGSRPAQVPGAPSRTPSPLVPPPPPEPLTASRRAGAGQEAGTGPV